MGRQAGTTGAGTEHTPSRVEAPAPELRSAVCLRLHRCCCFPHSQVSPEDTDRTRQQAAPSSQAAVVVSLALNLS